MKNAQRKLEDNKLRNEKTTPLKNVKKVLESLTNEQKKKKKCVFISTGSYNPVHYMHVRIFKYIKENLEKRDYVVLGGFISPSHDDYLRNYKFSDESLIVDIEDRWKCIEMTIEETKLEKFLVLDKWESLQDQGFIDYPKVTNNFRDYITKEIGRDVRVFYVCGTDHARYCKGMGSVLNNTGVVAFGRPGYGKSLKEKDDETFLICKLERIDSDCSSTIVRELMMKGKDKEVLEYIPLKVFKHLRGKGYFPVQ